MVGNVVVMRERRENPGARPRETIWVADPTGAVRKGHTVVKSFAERVGLLARLEPDRASVICEGQTYTRAAIAEHTAHLARCLAELGIAPGARVGVVARNSELHLVCALATSQVGAILVPLHFRSAPLEARRNLEDSGCSVVIFDRESAPSYAQAAGGTGFLGVVDDIENHSDVPASVPQGWLLLSEVCHRATRAPQAVAFDESAVAMIHYTSGSTGRAKGVCLTYRNIEASWENWAHEMPVGADDTVLTITPFAHVGGLQTFTLQVLVAGGTVVIQRHFDEDEALRQVERHGVTLMFCVPRIYAEMVHSPEFAVRDLSSLRCAVVGGAAVSPDLVATYARRGVPLCPSWGMTETCGGATLLPHGQISALPNSVGHPMLHVRVRLVDGQGATVGVKHPGNLQVRGASIAQGYWVNEEVLPLAASPDGWFDTGDVAEIDEVGNISITGRSSDRIISGGENIYPAEIERALSGCSGVGECAVIGVPDEQWGETPLVFVAASPDREPPSLEVARDYLALRISRYKLPRALVVIDALPRTGQTGKVDRRALVALAAQLPSHSPANPGG